MIISVEELKEFVSTNKADKVLELELLALEKSIRNYTNNNFQNINFRFLLNASNSKLVITTPYLKVGDTIQISQSKFNDGVYYIKEIASESITLNKSLYDEEDLLITKIEYPEDIKLGVIQLVQYNEKNRDKIGIASETISRHSVSYQNLDGTNTKIGFPEALVGFLKPYMKARF